MAEAPTTEPVVLTASRLTLADVVPPPVVGPWVPALASLALSLDRPPSPSAAPGGAAVGDEGSAYLRVLTRGDHGLSYVTVDELVGPIVGLAVDTWPGVDERGRLVFARAAVVDSLDLELELLQQFVTEHRRWSAARTVCPAELVDEPVRIGDVYGMTVTRSKARLRGTRLDRSGPLPTLRVPTGHGNDVVQLAGLYVGTAHCAAADIGADAREQARTAYYAAMASELDPRRRVDREIVQVATHAVLERLTKVSSGDR